MSGFSKGWGLGLNWIFNFFRFIQPASAPPIEILEFCYRRRFNFLMRVHALPIQTPLGVRRCFRIRFRYSSTGQYDAREGVREGGGREGGPVVRRVQS